MPLHAFEATVLRHFDGACNYARWLMKNSAEAPVRGSSVRPLDVSGSRGNVCSGRRCFVRALPRSFAHQRGALTPRRRRRTCSISSSGV